MSIHWFHKWSKWRLEQVAHTYVPTTGPVAGQRFKLVGTVQTRTCETCGKFQTQRVIMQRMLNKRSLL